MPDDQATTRRGAVLGAARDGFRLVRFIWRHPEVTDRRLNALFRLAAWQVWQRVVRRPWRVALSPSVHLTCHPHSASASGVIYCRYPEWREMRFLLDVLRPGDHFVDVGANVGVYTLLASTVPGTTVWAFEPSSLAAGRAEQNIRLNGLEDRCTLQRVAVGRAASRGAVTTDLGTMNRLAEVGTTAETEAVEIVTLDHAVPDAVHAHVALVKIDVEGDELAVLEGAGSLLERSGAIVLVEPNEPLALSEYLNGRGYERYGYEPVSRTLLRTDYALPGEINTLYIRDIESARSRLGTRDDSAALTVFGPTLSSRGGYLALQSQLADISATINYAVVGNESEFRQALPLVNAEVVEVSGHLAGARALRRHARTAGPVLVIAVQNPVIPILPFESSLVQNSLFSNLRLALRLHPDLRDWPWLLLGTVGTVFQVMRSAETVVLNSTYPEYWGRLTKIRVAPNILAPASLGYLPQPQREPVIVVVTSFYPFRGLHIAIAGFLASGLAHEGWEMVVHAARGGLRYETRCRQLAAGVPGVRFAGDDEPSRATLSGAALACFPSRIEGSSIAFLEALLLEPSLVVFDGPHFRQAVDAAGPIPDIEWVSSWDPGDWGAALSSAAGRTSVSRAVTTRRGPP